MLFSVAMEAESRVCMISTNLSAKLLMAVGVVTTMARASRAWYSLRYSPSVTY